MWQSWSPVLCLSLGHFGFHNPSSPWCPYHCMPASSCGVGVFCLNRQSCLVLPLPFCEVMRSSYFVMIISQSPALLTVLKYGVFHITVRLLCQNRPINRPAPLWLAQPKHSMDIVASCLMSHTYMRFFSNLQSCSILT